jgi:hypothetical protein
VLKNTCHDVNDLNELVKGIAASYITAESGDENTHTHTHTHTRTLTFSPIMLNSYQFLLLPVFANVSESYSKCSEWVLRSID